MLNDIDFFSNTAQMDLAVEDAKEIFGENLPYVIEKRVDGRTVIFNDHFIRTTREALSTGCLAKMNSMEVLLFEKWVAFENGSSYRDITKTDGNIVQALDAWFMDDLRCIAHPRVNSCFDAGIHSWEDCAVWQDL